MPVSYCDTHRPAEQKAQEQAPIPKQDHQRIKADDFLIKSGNLWKIVDSQQSTSAGESSDDDFYSARISQIPGLTMQGIVDEEMFEINLDDCSNEFFNGD